MKMVWSGLYGFVSALKVCCLAIGTVCVITIVLSVFGIWLLIAGGIFWMIEQELKEKAHA